MKHNTPTILKYDKAQIIRTWKDMLNMNGSVESLSDEYIEFIVWDVMVKLGEDVPELRQSIINKFPQFNKGDVILPISHIWNYSDNKIYVKLIAKPNTYYDEGSEVFKCDGVRYTMNEWAECCLNGNCDVIGISNGIWENKSLTCDEFEVEEWQEEKNIIKKGK